MGANMCLVYRAHFPVLKSHLSVEFNRNLSLNHRSESSRLRVDLIDSIHARYENSSK